jgi:2-amino-4-hydroxy-6-hydroxymethyldihydropteridine diphosphokinase
VTGTAGIPVLLGLGANLGDRLDAIQRAQVLLTSACGPLQSSPIYETAPWGDANQPPYLNAVVAGMTSLGPLALLQRCKEFERELGRKESRRWGPRAIDIDLLAYGSAWLRVSGLEIPHPRLHQRAFVLVPLTDLNPHWRHPLLDLSAADLLKRLPAAETEGIHRWPAAPSLGLKMAPGTAG